MKLKTDSGSLEMGGEESSWREISRRPNKCRHHSSLTCTAVISAFVTFRGLALYREKIV